jgi:hypothetical protein
MSAENIAAECDVAYTTTKAQFPKVFDDLAARLGSENELRCFWRLAWVHGRGAGINAADAAYQKAFK